MADFGLCVVHSIQNPNPKLYVWAHIAQQVEHILGKNEVIGSNPIVGSPMFVYALGDDSGTGQMI